MQQAYWKEENFILKMIKVFRYIAPCRMRDIHRCFEEFCCPPKTLYLDCCDRECRGNKLFRNSDIYLLVSLEYVNSKHSGKNLLRNVGNYSGFGVDNTAVRTLSLTDYIYLNIKVGSGITVNQNKFQYFRQYTRLLHFSVVWTFFGH